MKILQSAGTPRGALSPSTPAAMAASWGAVAFGSVEPSVRAEHSDYAGFPVVAKVSAQVCERNRRPMTGDSIALGGLVTKPAGVPFPRRKWGP